MNSPRHNYRNCNPFKCNYVAQVKMCYYGNKVTIRRPKELLTWGIYEQSGHFTVSRGVCVIYVVPRQVHKLAQKPKPMPKSPSSWRVICRHAITTCRMSNPAACDCTLLIRHVGVKLQSNGNQNSCGCKTRSCQFSASFLSL